MELDLNISGGIKISGGYDDGTVDIEFTAKVEQVIRELCKQFSEDELCRSIKEYSKKEYSKLIKTEDKK